MWAEMSAVAALWLLVAMAILFESLSKDAFELRSITVILSQDLSLTTNGA